MMNSNGKSMTRSTAVPASDAHMRAFESYLKSWVNLSQRAWHDLTLVSKPGDVPNRGVIVDEGRTFNNEVFIVAGVIRAYTVDEDGREKTTAFYQANEFMNIHTLRSQNGVSISTYQAISDSVIIMIEAKRFRNLLDQYPALMKLAGLVKNREVARLKSRDDCLLQVSGVEKYRKFKAHHPGIEEKIPQYYIASYLGISPVSLSRVRKKIENQSSH